MRRRTHIVSYPGAIPDRIWVETGMLEAESTGAFHGIGWEENDTTEGWRKWPPASFSPPVGEITCLPRDVLQG